MATRLLAPLLAFSWPILFFGDRVVPWHGTIRATGNDFLYLYYAYKAYLLDCLAHFRFPLWSPTEGAGFPFYASPFTQAFYPLNAPLAIFHALAGGYSPHDHQLFTALGTGLFALGVFAWLRSLGHGPASALLAAGLVSTSFRVGDMLRMPNAVHTAAWYPWILLAFNRILGAGRTPELARWLLGLFGFLLAFLTAGYLYYVYYSVFLFGPYLLLAVVPALRRFIVPEGGEAWRKRMGLIGGVCALALAACWPYLARVKQLLDATSGRTGTDAAANAWYGFHFSDTLSSLVYPVGASPEGCYYFGLAGLLLIALYVLGTWRNAGTTERLLCGTLLGWFLLVSYLSYEEGSQLFLLLKHTLPGFQRLRVWGRIGIILLPVLAWLLARAFEHFQARLGGAHATWKPLFGCYLALLSLQGLQARAGAHRYYGAYFPELSSWAAWYLVAGLLALLCLCALLGLSRKKRLSPRTTVAVLLVVSALDVWPVGARLWSERQAVPRRMPFDVQAVLERSLSEPRHATYGTISVVYDPALTGMRLAEAANVAIIPEWYFARYARFLARGQLEPLELEYLLGLRDGRRLFLSARIDHDRLRTFMEDCASAGGDVLVRAYNGDRLEAQVQTPSGGFLTFVDNWDPDWLAFVDGRESPVIPAFGTFKAVAVPPGAHRVVFRYAPFP